MKSRILRLRRYAKKCLHLAVIPAVFWVGQVMADLPTVETIPGGGGGGTYGTFKNYIKNGLLLLGLVVCAIAFLSVAHNAITSYHGIKAQKNTWGEFLAFVITGIGLILGVIYLCTQAAQIL
ncbi:integrating conjugative element membrane protein [Pantoea ananatis 15320]|uniref:TIGR03745 family integrating conjugative element membrane protein n=1 Tax=Pantoea ananas TaxID=553 RepID=UPI0003B19062|nr:TIGR03745 family integrating conjugative element membrane protein [Pantoea ananatis]ERM15734.1 hypothetical protein L585_02615 [Pantoea ananatis BRT175]PKC41343.1 integrating conjugative element membrane protein [Pantoea ananatis 15320]